MSSVFRDIVTKRKVYGKVRTNYIVETYFCASQMNSKLKKHDTTLIFIDMFWYDLCNLQFIGNSA